MPGERSEPLLRDISLAAADRRGSEYPFTVPSIAGLTRLTFSSRVTFFCGENGSGKSTLLEAIALAAGLAYDGGSKNFRPPPRASFRGESQEERIRVLADALIMRWRKRPRDAFFLRAESFDSVITYLERAEQESGQSAFGSYGGVSLHTRSHGESFLALLLNRISGGGLYVIDEPEAALSAARQLTMLARMRTLLDEHPDTQFIIASHSPILLAFPGAAIYSFDRSPIARIPYFVVSVVKPRPATCPERRPVLSWAATPPAGE